MPSAARRPPGRPRPGRSWRCGSNYSAGREVGEDRRGRRRLGRGGVAFAAHRLGGPHALFRIPRTEVAAALLGQEIAVVGGFLCAAARTPRADAYSPARNRWRRLPDLPVTVDHAMAAGVAGRLYVVGGYGPGSVARNTAFAFHHGHWTPSPSMPAPRAAGGAIVGGKLYVVGGVEVRAGWPATHSRSISRRRAGPRSAARGLASTSARLRSAGGSTSSPEGREGSTPTRTSSRRSTRAADGGGRFFECRKRGGTAASAVGGRLLSAGGEEPAERSEPCTPTRPRIDGGRSCHGCGRPATGSAWSAGVAAWARSPAARSRG